MNSPSRCLFSVFPFSTSYLFTGSCRARVAYEFILCTDQFMDGGLAPLTTPFITFHSPRDTFTDPSGSAFLAAEAKSTDKTYLTVGPGCDVNVSL